MENFKIFVILLAIGVASAELIEIPEEYRNAKDINESPERQEILRQNFPQLFEASENKSTGKVPFIIGGSNATRGQFPYQVLIYIIYPNRDVYLCGGSLIDQFWILTAAHCVYKTFDYLQIYTGVTNTSGPATWETRVTKQNTRIHQNYNNDHLWNDIALLKIPDAPSNLLNDIYVDVIALPKNQTSNNFVGSVGTVSGFGRFADASTSTSPLLKYVDLEVITNAECERTYGTITVLPTNICTRTTPTAATCGGDSGGPLMIYFGNQRFLAGIVSFGAKDGCQLGLPSGFTRVTSYIDWIEKTMNSSPKTLVINSIFVLISPFLLVIFKL